MITRPITETDDSFHPPVGDNPYWTETCWFSFDQPERSLSLAVYPLFRPNQGVCSLAIHLWDHTGVAPWELPYSRFLWHLPMPTSDLSALELAGLRLTAEKPLQRYAMSFSDGDRVSFDLEFDALREPIGSSTQMPTADGRVGGHFDQTVRARGEVSLHGERIAIDTFGHRDRSWYDRPDDKPRPSASVCHGAAEDGTHFVALRPTTLLGMADESRPPGGYLVQDGEIHDIVEVNRRVVVRDRGMPREIELSIADEAGRRLELHGRAKNHLAFHTSPPVFAWFSQYEWVGADRTFVGQDQEASSMHRIARLIAGDADATPS